MVQLISKLTLTCAKHVCVLQFLLSDTLLKRVTCNGLHACNICDQVCKNSPFGHTIFDPKF